MIPTNNAFKSAFSQVLLLFPSGKYRFIFVPILGIE